MGRSKPIGDSVMVMALGHIEVALLGGLLDELDELASDPPLDDPVTQRLFPAGYQDEQAAEDFRALTQLSLAQERRGRYAECRAELPVREGELVLSAEEAARWLVVLNDMRLALGTRLGVTADGFADDDIDLADDAPGSDEAERGRSRAARAAYHWLTAIQDDLVISIMR
jgi:hypothetical protein